jgi:branched-chain amino acid aminotransferase
MSDKQLFGVTAQGAVPLDVPSHADSFVDMLQGFPLGVYSALRTFEHNKFLDLQGHLARTLHSMALIGWDYKFDEARFRQALHQAVTAYPLADARVRFDILAAPVQRQGVEIQELIALRPFSPVPRRFYEQGVGVDFAQGFERPLPGAKTADFAQKREPLALGQDQDHYERLIVDGQGHILEGLMTNFWAVLEGTVYTAGQGILEGITRKIILSLIPDLHIPLRLEAIHTTDLIRLEEAAISGSSRALLPVVRINGKVVGNGRPGPVTHCILRAYEEFVAGAIKTAV